MKTSKGSHTCTVEIWFVNRSQRWCKLLTKVIYVQLGSDLQINLKDDAQESLICTLIWFVNGSGKLFKEVLYVRLRSELLFKMNGRSKIPINHAVLGKRTYQLLTFSILLRVLNFWSFKTCLPLLPILIPTLFPRQSLYFGILLLKWMVVQLQ